MSFCDVRKADLFQVTDVSSQQKFLSENEKSSLHFTVWVFILKGRVGDRSLKFLMMKCYQVFPETSVPVTLNAVFRLWFWGKDGKPWSECMFLISPGNLVHWQWDSGRVACRERLLKATKSMRHSHFRPLLHPAHNLQSTTQLQTSTHCLPAMYILSMEDYRIFLHKGFCYYVPCTWCIYVTTYLLVWLTYKGKHHMQLKKSSW